MIRNSSTQNSAQSRRRIVLWIFAALIVLFGIGAWLVWFRISVSAEELLIRALDLRSAGKLVEAERAAAKAFDLQPDSYEAAKLAAECAVDRKDHAGAVAYLRRVASSDRAVRIEASLWLARLNHLKRHYFDEAESDYRTVLDLDPENIEANRGLATLLGVCGRRSDAIPYAIQLIRQQQETDLLVLLARENGIINDLGALELARAAQPYGANASIGLAWHASAAEDHKKAIGVLNQSLHTDNTRVASHAALGKALLATRQFDALVDWETQLPKTCNESGDVWFVRGAMAEQVGDHRGAIRCFGESLRRIPESKAATFRIVRLLSEAGAADESARFATRLQLLQELEQMQDRVLFSGQHSSIEPALELAKCYASVGRLWEAYAWCQLAVRVNPSHQKAQHDVSELRDWVKGLPLRLTTAEANVAFHLDLSKYPLPRFEKRETEHSASTTEMMASLSFRDDAPSVGLNFEYFNGTGGVPSRRMFEFTGGGIGVVDFDLDAFPDILFTQGTPWPPGSANAGFMDRFFRNLSGTTFEEITTKAGINENGFGQGVSVGDFDADGFPDLYVANIGGNALWKNHGDGTFSDVTSFAGLIDQQWTTSCLLADVDGDRLPDIYDVNYVAGKDVFERLCPQADGQPRMCMPFHFDASPDKLWINSGDGRFTDRTLDTFGSEPLGKGLGVAAWDATGTGRLSVFVANDTTPSFFFVPQVRSDGSTQIIESGLTSGLALNGAGKATGCMGVALADINRDDRLDVFVTNFLGEPNTLFVSQSGSVFEDRTQALGLHAPSLNVLGFGTQFLDVDSDGRLELFVANGHIDDLRSSGRPYAMPPQLFRWSNRQFVEVAPQQLGSYFEQKWLGRSVARLDWNRDGLDDLVVGHLESPSALLTNNTRENGSFVALRLFGVQSNRDAIGATVSIRVGDRSFVRQMTGGDGYQASNERRIVFGVGNADRIDQVTVRWPSGLVQQFENVLTRSELWLVEGHRLRTSPMR